MSYWNSFTKGIQEFTTEVLKEEDEEDEENQIQKITPRRLQQTNQQQIEELQLNLQEKNENLKKLSESFEEQFKNQHKEFQTILEKKDEEIKILKKQLLSGNKIEEDINLTKSVSLNLKGENESNISEIEDIKKFFSNFLKIINTKEEETKKRMKLKMDKLNKTKEKYENLKKDQKENEKEMNKEIEEENSPTIKKEENNQENAYSDEQSKIEEKSTCENKIQTSKEYFEIIEEIMNEIEGSDEEEQEEFLSKIHLFQMNFTKKLENVEQKMMENQMTNKNIMNENGMIEKQLLILTEGSKLNLTESIEFLKNQNLKLHHLEEENKKKELSNQEISKEFQQFQEKIMNLLNQYGVRIEEKEDILNQILDSLSQKVTNFNTLLCVKELTKNPSLCKEFSINPEVPCDFQTVEQLIKILIELLESKEKNEILNTINVNLTEEKANLLKSFQEKMNNAKNNSSSQIGSLQTDVQTYKAKSEEKSVKIERLNIELNELNFKLKETKMNYQDTIDVLNKKIDKLTKQNIRIEQALEKSKEDFVKSQELLDLELMKNQSIMGDEEKKYEDLIGQISNYESEISSLQFEINKKNRVLDENEKALNDFENVLEVFQEESQQEILKLEKNIEKKKQEIETLKVNLNKFETLSNELKQKNENLISMEDEYYKMKETLNKSILKSNYFYQMLQESIARVNDINLVDRRIIINLLLRYLENKEDQVLNLLSSTLRLTNFEKEKLDWITGKSSTGYISGWFSSTGPPTSPNSKLSEKQRSFSQLWVEFLMKESNE